MFSKKKKKKKEGGREDGGRERRREGKREGGKEGRREGGRVGTKDDAHKLFTNTHQLQDSNRHTSLVPRRSCVGGEKRAWYTLFAHAQFSQDFWEFGNFP